ncbi:MAG: PDZ domain-containing protein, partial [Candidatus Hydrogenedentes bacterium]|nr:PDZ domain-containing protein [Candidatus Hydrogenedentota bacterium]
MIITRLSIIRNTTAILFAYLICFFSIPVLADTALSDSIKSAVAKVNPSLVRIHVVEAYYREGREMKYEASGSGVVISPAGHIITNHHVAGHAKQIKCVFADKSEYEAELVGTDPLTDIAVLLLKNNKNISFPTVTWGDSSLLQKADHVLAMGSPLALSQSVTLGIISNTEMIMPEWMNRYGGLTMDGEDVGALVRWVAHDAQIFGGNSGGPLINLNGEIIGINEISLGLSGAIPSNLAKSVATELIETGSVRRAWVGIDVQPRLKSSEEHTGALISGTIAGSPAEKATIKSGDLLLSIANTPVDIQFPVQLPDLNLLICSLPIGEEVPFVIKRGRDTHTIKVTPIEREPYEPKQFEQPQWGITIRNLSFMMAREMKRKTTDGVLITSVRSGGPAGDARPPLKENDVIIRVGDVPVKNINEFLKVTNDITKESTDPIPVLTTFERKTNRLLTVAKVGIRALSDPGLEVKKSWLPVEYQVITRDIAKLLSDSTMTGFRITHVYKNSLAAEAGLLVGDLILAVDDEKMTASSPEHHEELSAYIRQYPIGETVTLKLSRNGKDLTQSVKLAQSPKLAREMKKYQDKIFEFTVRNITFFDRASERWEETQQGVLVEQVKPGGWAALGRISVGDLIISIDQETVNTV